MLQRKSKKIILYFFLILILASINNADLNNLKLYKINKINISGIQGIEKKILLKNIENLNLTNIFFLNASEISRIIDSNTFIENYKIFKKYPSTLNIEIKETNFLAKINLDNQLFYVGSNGRLIDLNFTKEKLPYIFGKPDIDEFLEFKKIIDNSKILYKEIISFYYFPSKRWDIKLKNNILIKLPKNETKKSLNDVVKFLDENDLNNINIVDARIKNQIILND